MAQDADYRQPVPAHGIDAPRRGQASLVQMPQELLGIIATDPALTNRDRKQVRLACRDLEAAITPFVFKRIVVSKLRADRDAFLSVAADPRLAACVEEVVWLELGCDGSALEHLPSDLEGFEDLKSNLLGTADDLFWLTKSGKSEGREFLGQFKAAIDCMPRVRGFSSEPMRWDRQLCTHPDKYPLDVGLMTTHAPKAMWAWTQGLMKFLLPTMRQAPGKITRLRCSAGLFETELGHTLSRSHIPSTFKHLTSINLSYSWAEWRTWVHWKHPEGSGHAYLRSLQSALFAAEDLQELSISFDCATGGYAPPFRLPDWMFMGEDGRPHKWKRLRSLRFAHLLKTEAWLVPLISAHADSLRHLELEQCNLKKSFALLLALEAGMLRPAHVPDAIRLHSIIINEPGVHESALISEQTLLHFIHHGAAELFDWLAGKAGPKLTSQHKPLRSYNPMTSNGGGAGHIHGGEHSILGHDNDDDDDYEPTFEYVAEAEEDWNSDEGPPPLLSSIDWDLDETQQILCGRFVTHSDGCRDVGGEDCDEDADDQASDHSSEWWSDTDSELDFVMPVEVVTHPTDDTA